MKIKNLLLVPLLSAALVATSCSPAQGGDSTSGSDTSGESQKVVTRVTVKQISSVVVGETLDFDTLVDVYYDDESTGKDYTLEVPAASKDLVQVNGKNATFLKEGAVTITVKAGEQSAKFNSNVFSKLKKDLIDNTSSIGSSYAMYRVGAGNALKPSVIHKDNYYFAQDQDADLGDGDGCLKTNKGNVYEYEIVSGALDVKSENYKDYIIFEMIDFEFDYNDCVTKSDENGDYLYLDASFPAGTLAQYNYESFVRQFAVAASDFTLNTEVYKWNSIEVRPFAVAENVERFAFSFYAEPVAGGDRLLAFTDVLFYADDEGFYSSELVEDYIAAGTEPVTLPFDDVKDFVDNTIDGTTINYTATLEASIYDVNPDTGVPTGVIENTMNEVYVATDGADGAYEIDATLAHGDGDYGGYFAPAGHIVKGYANHEGNAYSYVKDGETNPATKEADSVNIYELPAIKTETFASLSAEEFWSGFFVTKIVEDSENHKATYSLATGESAAFVKKVLNLTYAGYYFLAALDTFQSEYSEMIFGYGETYIELQYDNADENIVSLEIDYYGMLFGDTYFDFELVFDHFGTTPAVDLSGITW